MTKDEDPQAGALSALDAGLSVLQILCETGGPHTLGEISAQLSLSKSRVYRILSTLKQRRFVQQAMRGGPYGPGDNLEFLGFVVTRQISLLRIAKPIVIELSQTLRGTVVLRVLDRGDQLTRDCVHSPETLRTSFPVGVRLPATYGSTGKALFAFSTPAAREAMLHQQSPALAAKLRSEVEEIRGRGYAVNIEETVKGVRGIGAPILDMRGVPIAALGISFPAFALPRSRIAKAGRALIDACETVNFQLEAASQNQLEGASQNRAKTINRGRKE